MKIIEVDESTYAGQVEQNSNFLQSVYHDHKRINDGWQVEYVNGIEDDKVVCVGTLAYIPVMKIYKYCYCPRGFIMDHTDKHLIDELTSALKQYLKRKNVLYFEMDPMVELQERDINGDIVEGGFDHHFIVDNLKAAGFEHLGFPVGYNNSKEVRYVQILDLKDKNVDEVFAKFSYQTRQDIRTAQKYGVKVRELDVDELSILDEMELETSKRRDFKAMSLEYYQELYKFYGKERIHTMYAYLDLDEYSKTIFDEYDKTASEMETIKAFLETNPNSTKKQKKLKTLDEYYRSLGKKKAQFEQYKNDGIHELALACSLFIEYGDEIVYLVGASDYAQRNFRGPYAIQWTMIQKAIEKHYSAYNFYGISGYFKKGEDGFGVFDFKRGFNARVVEYIGNFILPIKPKAYELYKKLK